MAAILITVAMILVVTYFYILPTLKDRVIAVNRMLIMPAMFLVMFFSKFSDFSPLSLQSKYILALGLAVGLACGIVLRLKTPIKADKQKALIWLPGSYASLINFLVIFALHFVWGLSQSINADWFVNDLNKEIFLFLLAAGSTFNAGMVWCLLYKYTRNDENFVLVASP
jgi:hypothetical protein